MADWHWNEALRRYQDVGTGRILPFARVTALVDEVIDRTNATVTDQLASLLGAGRLNVGDWEARMRTTIKDAYIQQAILAAGGREQMTQAMWGATGGAIGEQYRWLDGFSQRIANGELTEGQVRTRARMYVNSSREAFWRIRDRIERDKGSTEERWIPIGDDATCGPCFDAGQMDWQPLGTFAQPGSGQVVRNPATQCQGLTNCRCTKEYR